MSVYSKAVENMTPALKAKLETIKGTPAESFLRLAINLPSIRKKASSKIEKVISDIYGVKTNAAVPLCLPSKADPMKVVVYKNIDVKAKPEAVIEHVLNLLGNDKTKERLATKDRAIKLITKKEETTLVKFIAENTNIKDRHKDDYIKRTAEQLAVLFTIPEIVLCEKPKDYYEMFKVKNGSCMTVGSSYSGDITKITWPKVAEDTGHYPSAWYHYQPYAKGGYLKAGDVPVVRFMLYRTTTDGPWETYGDVKYSQYGLVDILKKHMETLGVKSGTSAETIFEYRVPGITHELLNDGKTKHCPLPNCDNQRKDFSVAFDSTTGEFVFGKTVNHKDWTRITDTYGHTGYINSAKVFELGAEKVTVKKPTVVGQVKPVEIAEVAAVAKKPRAKQVAGPVAVDVVKKVAVKTSVATMAVADYLITIG